MVTQNQLVNGSRWLNSKRVAQLLIAFWITGHLTSVSGQVQPSSANFDFKGRMLVAVSDADMLASAYIDGHLGPVVGNDVLTVIRLDKPVSDLKPVSVGVSNSVTGPPSSVAVSPDGRYAIVVETRGARSSGKADPLLSDLPMGKAITVVDLNNPEQPTVIQRIDGFERPQSVAFNADGSLVVIAYYPVNTTQKPLVLYRFNSGKLSSPTLVDVPGWTGGEQLNGAEFHPKENTLAILNASKPSLTFAKVVDTNGKLSLSIWGNPVGVEKQPFQVRFTPDGRFAVLNCMYFGADVSGTATLPASVLSVRVAGSTTTNGMPVHQIVSRILAGNYAEGMSMSPDGRWIATANLEQSSHPVNSPEQGFFSSVSLIRFDAQLGLLERVGTYAFDGILPESVLFDNTSRYLAVATFDHYDPQRSGHGAIDFWRLSGDAFDPKRTELVKTNYSIPVMRGVHSMVIVR